MNAKRKPDGARREGPVTAVLFGTLFAAVADNQIISPLLPDILGELSIATERGGFLVSVYAFAAAGTSFFLGPLSDRVGRKALLMWGLATFALSTALCGAAWDFNSLLIFRGLTGGAAGAISLSITALVGDYFPYERRGRAMGIVMSGYFAAMIIGVPLGAFIASATSWRFAFYIFAAVAALLWVPQWIVIPVIKPDNPKASTLADSMKAYGRFLSLPGPSTAVLASLLVSASTVGFITYVGTWLRDAYGLSTDRIGLIFLASGAAALIGSPVAGAIADRLGKRLVVVTSSIVMAVCLAGIPWITSSLPLVFVGFIITGISGAFRQAPLQALITGLASDEDRGTLIALKNTFAEIGIAVGTALSGFLYVAWGYGAVGLTSATMAVVAAVMIGLGVKEPKNHT
ncbi:MAG: MFS transporter [Candidatus Latescibacteria bacterium]|nr:MFS transporter [Candidatus Latescibacterota bacterium]